MIARKIDNATREWIKGPADELAVRNGCRFDPARAERVCEFFRSFLRHSKGAFADQPFELLDWQRDDIIYPLFGWLRPDGNRRFRRAYVEIPKKNGKSTLAAGIGLYMLVADRELGAQVYSAAADREQASIVHGEAINMVDASPELSDVLDINRSTRNIFFKDQRAYYRALSNVAKTKEGFDGHACIIDELHIWPGRELWDALRYMGRARRQPLIFVITTAGANMLSVCREQHDYARGILDGTVEDDRYFAYIRAATKEEIETRGVDDRDLWRQANPSMGITIDEDEFGRDVAEAVQTPTAYSSFLRYSFNVWATAENPWLKMEDWEQGHEPIDEAKLIGQPCWAGLDLAKITDLTSLVLTFRDLDRGVYRQLAYFWMPEETAHERRDLAPYLLWAEQGHLFLTDGNVCDYQAVKSHVAKLAKRFKIRELAFDPWNAEDTTQQIETELGIKRIEFRQSMANFAEPCKEYERLVRAGKLKHDHPILSWQSRHVSVKTDESGNIRPVKPKHGDHRTIDGIVAGIMSLDRAQRAPKPAKGSLCLV